MAIMMAICFKCDMIRHTIVSGVMVTSISFIVNGEVKWQVKSQGDKIIKGDKIIECGENSEEGNQVNQEC
jgi:hypothetical protein